MSETTSREPAFPRSYSHDGHNGMSLRDWFAGQALVGAAQYQSCQPSPEGMAQRAYELADAMLKAMASS